MIKRNFKFENRADDNSALQGYAFLFSETAEGWLGKERFSPDLQVEIHPRCSLLRDHDSSKVLARVGANMSVKTDDQGLYFSVSKLPDTQLARETESLVKTGVLSGASVGFTVITERTENKINVFESIKLYEISLVVFPYYESSEVRDRESATKGESLWPPEILL